jgi:hypothetical protein
VKPTEIISILQEALDMCYRSNGSQLPDTILKWYKNGVRIDYGTLPENLKEGITGILMQSNFKKVIKQIFINLP